MSDVVYEKNGVLLLFNVIISTFFTLVQLTPNSGLLLNLFGVFALCIHSYLDMVD
jgi:hypothetical protein